MSCEFCKDDYVDDIVCYLPTNNGDAKSVPVNHCPNCGAPLTQPKPLTVEQLREMDGGPVYDWHLQEWFVISDVDVIDELMSEINMTDGTIVDWDETAPLPKFYTHEPEQEGEI